MKLEIIDLKMVLQQKVSIFILGQMLFVLSVSCTNSNIYFQCSQFNFDLSTPYELNVNSLFTSMVNSAAISNFNTFEISLPENAQTNVVYGLFQCQGDLNSQCKDCVTRSISQLKSICPVSVGATIQLEGCFVKYDNVSFFGVDDTTEMLKKCGPSIVSNADVLNSIDTTLTNLIAGNGQYFRTGDFGSIHGVAQCVQDLSVSDCQDCLSLTSGRLRSECEKSSSGDMYLGKCYIRYSSDSKNENSSDNRTRDELFTPIIVTVIGNSVSALLIAVISAIVSSKVAEAKVEPVKSEAAKANKTAEAASITAHVASEKANAACEKAQVASEKADAACRASTRAERALSGNYVGSD